MKYSFRYFLKTTRDILLKFYGLFEIRIRIKFDFLFVLRLRLRSCHSLRPNYLLLSVFSFVYKYLYNCQIEGSRIISWDVLFVYFYSVSKNNVTINRYYTGCHTDLHYQEHWILQLPFLVFTDETRDFFRKFAIPPWNISYTVNFRAVTD